jgi:hypothetical protein
MGSPKFLGSNFWSFAFTFRAAVLLGLGEGVVGDGVEEGVTAGVGDGLAGDVGAGCGEDPALQAAADATTNALATASDVWRRRRRAITSRTLGPHADVPDRRAGMSLDWLLITQQLPRR